MATDIFPYESASALCAMAAAHINAVYIEFENNSGAPVSPPTPTRSEGASYYASLAMHPTRDYLRVPVGAITTKKSSETYPQPNELTVFAVADGSSGVHGKAFSATAQSRVYGGALVYAPDYSDATKDLILCRFYFDADEQAIKTTNTQIHLTRSVTFQ